METAATRAVVEKFLAARAANDGAAIDALLTDDACWTPPGSVLKPVEGREATVKALTGGAIGKFLDVSTVQRTVKKVIAEGDTAVVLQDLAAKTVSGGDYTNNYVWVYTCRDGKISRLDEYVDTYRAMKAFGMI